MTIMIIFVRTIYQKSENKNYIQIKNDLRTD